MAGQTKALVLEPCPELSEAYSRTLTGEGLSVTASPDGAGAVQAVRDEEPDFVILGVGRPDLDGFEVCRRIREFSDAYIIMTSARASEMDRVVGLSIGADDYLTRPFSDLELAARIRAMRRRPRAATREAELRRFGRISIDRPAREVRIDGSVVDLTRVEFDILDMLSSAPRRVFRRAQILDRVWGGSWYGDDHVIDVHMGNLRRKLGESASAQGHIRTVRGVGYRFEPSPPR
jgi:DNA-binding response OmpR family regulator